MSGIHAYAAEVLIRLQMYKRANCLLVSLHHLQQSNEVSPTPGTPPSSPSLLPFSVHTSISMSYYALSLFDGSLPVVGQAQQPSLWSRVATSNPQYCGFFAGMNKNPPVAEGQENIVDKYLDFSDSYIKDTASKDMSNGMETSVSYPTPPASTSEEAETFDVSPEHVKDPDAAGPLEMSWDLDYVALVAQHGLGEADSFASGSFAISHYVDAIIQDQVPNSVDQAQESLLESDSLVYGNAPAVSQEPEIASSAVSHDTSPSLSTVMASSLASNQVAPLDGWRFDQSILDNCTFEYIEYERQYLAKDELPRVSTTVRSWSSNSPCPHCKRAIVDARNRPTHAITHVHKSRRLKPYKCIVCDKGFYRRQDAKNHFKRFH
ncbi:hypothetical protein HDU97_008563 [Phlyctochytrium planicorne]|nr:hypothetical protein HDU97_008563 [Phlyctochytrium planicorne]